MSRKQKHKLKLLDEQANDENALIIALTETHLNNNIRNAEIHINKYTPFRQDRREGRRKGGIITYIHDIISPQCQVLLSASNQYTEYNMLYFTKIKLICITIYRPPQCPKEFFLPVLNNIRSKIEGLNNTLPDIIMTGDLIFPIINWTDETVNTGGGTDEKEQSEKLLKFAGDHAYLNTY